MPSSVIQSFSYDKKRRALTIRFVSGRVYTYADVPAELVEGLAGAASKGHFYNEEIRDRFAFVRHPSRGG